MNYKIISILAYVILVLMLLALIGQDAVIADGTLGKVIQLGAVALMIWARVAFGGRSFHASADPTEGGLVTTGPYRYFRHPIYASIFYFFWAAVLTHFSGITFIIGIVATAAIMVRIISEERLLVVRYPEYAEYASRTKRIIPYVF
jgi:protein-S-isoprenylcysteine O-methyltransferase Ste14